jgi:hypothetical protein
MISRRVTVDFFFIIKMNILKKIKSKATVQNESTVIKPPEIIDLPVEKS